MEKPVCFLAWVALLVTVMAAADESASLEPCPSVCRCKNRNKYIYCERKKLQSIPKGIPVAAEELYLGYNIFTVITNGSFSTLGNLTTLSLKGNRIDKIEPLGFNGLRNLKILYLTTNILETIDKEVFKGLTHLRNLYLSQNRLSSIPDLGYATSLKKINLDTNRITSASFPPGYKNLTLLNNVVLTNNNIAKLRKSDFNVFGYPGCKVVTLKLGRCGIKDIEDGTFEPFTALQSLTLSYNQLNATNVKNVVDGLKNSHIVSLDLSGVIQGGSLPADSFAALEKVPLTTLKLAHSDFTIIHDGTFRPLSRLMFLDLSYSGIAVSEPKAFTGLYSLERLYLRHNSLNALPQNFPSKVTDLDLSSNHALTELPAKGFINMKALVSLNLFNCGVLRISSDAFLGIEQLKILDMSRNHIGGTNIPSKALSNMYKLEKLLLDHNKIDSIKTGNPLFKGLESLKILDLSSNECGQIPSDLFTGLTNLSILYLQGNKLGYNVSNFGSGLFTDLGNLTSLHLENNYIKTLPASLFKGLKSLKNMSLSSNLITDWPEGASQYLSKLTYLDLSVNQMSTIKVAEFSPFKPGFSMNLTGNPFDCWCDLRDFRQWLNQTDVVFVNLTHYECNSPESMAGKPLLSFDPTAIHEQCQPLPWKIICSASLGGFAGLVAITAVLGYRYRWKLRLRWYNMKRGMRRRSPTPTPGQYGRLHDQDDGHTYDAYISAFLDSAKDRDWVTEELLPKMDKDSKLPEGWEAGRFKLCYEDRDLNAGGNNMADVVEHMLNSKKVILVISNEYLNSNRHRQFELEFAASRTPERGLNYVIPLFLDPGVDVKVPKSLRLRLEKLEDRIETWNNDPDAQKIFWGRLSDLINAPPPNLEV